MQFSKNGFKLLANFEGVVPFAYLCNAKRLTIGVGHLVRQTDFFMDIISYQIKDLEQDILKYGKEFNQGYVVKNNKKIFFPVKTSAGVKRMTRLTPYQIEYLFQKDVAEYVDCVNDIGKVLNQNQFDALVCLCYNIGKTAFKRSELVRKLKMGCTQLKEDFLNWNKITDSTSKEKVVDLNLHKRRLKEWELFSKES